MGLLQRIKKTNVTRSVWTQMAQITILCGLIVVIGTSTTYESTGYEWANYAISTALTVTAVTFLVWLTWFLYIVCDKRTLRPMDSRGYNLLDSIDCVLFAYWVISYIFPAATGIWVLPIAAAVWVISAAIAIKHS